MTKNPRPTDAEAIRAIALAQPEATEDLPWGHSAFKVRAWPTSGEKPERQTSGPRAKRSPARSASAKRHPRSGS